MENKEYLIKEFNYCRICRLIKPKRSPKYPSMCGDCAKIYEDALKKVELSKERYDEYKGKDLWDVIFEKGEEYAELKEQMDKVIEEFVKTEQELKLLLKEANMMNLDNDFISVERKTLAHWILDAELIKNRFKMIFDSCFKIEKEEILEVKRKQI